MLGLGPRLGCRRSLQPQGERGHSHSISMAQSRTLMLSDRERAEPSSADSVEPAIAALEPFRMSNGTNETVIYPYREPLAWVSHDTIRGCL